MIKAVLFDFDDTLYEYEKTNLAGERAVYEILKDKNISFEEFKEKYYECKVEIHRELAGTASSHNRVLYFHRFIEKTHRDVKPSLILDMYDAYWNAFLENMVLHNRVIEVLKELKKKRIKIGIVTNLTTHIQLRKLKKLGLEDYVDILVTSEEVGAEKPRAIMFLKALNKLDLKPKEALMVGDSLINDIEGGNSVGLKTVLIDKKGLDLSDINDYRKPDYVIKDIKELLNIIK